MCSVSYVVSIVFAFGPWRFRCAVDQTSKVLVASDILYHVTVIQTCCYSKYHCQCFVSRRSKHYVRTTHHVGARRLSEACRAT